MFQNMDRLQKVVLCKDLRYADCLTRMMISKKINCARVLIVSALFCNFKALWQIIFTNFLSVLFKIWVGDGGGSRVETMKDIAMCFTGERCDHSGWWRQSHGGHQRLSNLVPRKMEYNARKFPRNPEPRVSVGRPYRYFDGQVSVHELINSDVMAPA